MNRGIFLSLITLGFSVVSAFAGPDPGVYTGVLRVTKTRFNEFLSSTYTLRTQANVAEDGKITILTTVPESPAAAADPESTITRAEPVPPSVTGPLPGAPLAGNNYTVDGRYPAFVTGSGAAFKLQYEVGRDPNSNVIDLRVPTTSFTFVFRRQRAIRPAAAR